MEKNASGQRGADFDPHGQSLLTFTRNQWKLWSTSQAAVEASHSDTAERYTALCWGPAVEKGKSSSWKSDGTARLLMVLGCASGRLQIWDARSCEFVCSSEGFRSLTVSSAAAVRSLALLSSRSSVLCGSPDMPEVVEVRLHDGGIQDHWKCDNAGVLGMCTASKLSSSFLCTAGPKKLRLWDLARRGNDSAGPHLCAKLTAPSSSAGAGRGFSLDLCTRGPPLLLCCEGSQSVSVWCESTLKATDGKSKEGSKAKTADILLTSHERILAAHISRTQKVNGVPSSSDRVVVVGVIATGLLVWSFIPASCKRSIAPSQTISTEAFSDAVLCARLVSPVEACVASGPHAVPTFLKVELPEDGQPVITTLGAKKKKQQLLDSKAAVSGARSARGKVVLGSFEVAASMPRTQKRSSPSEAIEVESKRPKTEELQQEGASKRQASAISLAPVVRQSLRASDPQTMEVVLRTADKRVIVSTVSELSGAEAYDLIQECASRLQSQPVRGQVLSEWIRSAMLEHAAYIRAQPRLRSGLEPVYEALKRRIGAYSSLMRLQGRMEILLGSGRAIAAATKRKRAGASTPFLDYHEGDEDMPGELGDDEDVGEGDEDAEDESDFDFSDDDDDLI